MRRVRCSRATATATTIGSRPRMPGTRLCLVDAVLPPPMPAAFLCHGCRRGRGDGGRTEDLCRPTSVHRRMPRGPWPTRAGRAHSPLCCTLPCWRSSACASSHTGRPESRSDRHPPSPRRGRRRRAMRCPTDRTATTGTPSAPWTRPSVRPPRRFNSRLSTPGRRRSSVPRRSWQGRPYATVRTGSAADVRAGPPSSARPGGASRPLACSRPRTGCRVTATHARTDRPLCGRGAR